MIIVDIETTGVNFLKHGIVSIGAVELERPDREYYGECRIALETEVSDEAVEITGIDEKKARDEGKQDEATLIKDFFSWAMEAEEHTVAGQNPMFDLTFIQLAAWKHHIENPLAHRSIDLHSVCFAHMRARNLTPPTDKGRSALNSDAIMKYVGIPAEPKPHIAINGARYETEAFSRMLHDKVLLERFAKYPIPWQDYLKVESRK